MAQITLNIPDQHVQRVIDAFVILYAYDPETSTLTPAQFIRSKIRDYIKEVVVRSELTDRKQLVTEVLQAEVDGIDIT